MLIPASCDDVRRIDRHRIYLYQSPIDSSTGRLICLHIQESINELICHFRIGHGILDSGTTAFLVAGLVRGALKDGNDNLERDTCTRGTETE